MNEGLLSSSAATLADGALVESTGGGMLRAAREAKGLHISALSASLKVSVKKLEAIEANQFDALPDIVFARALASSICRHLKIDPTPILEKLPPVTSPGLKTDESGINMPFRASGQAPGLTRWLNISKPAMLASISLLLFAIVLVWVTWIQKPDPVPSPNAEANSATMLAASPAPAASEVPASVASSTSAATASELTPIALPSASSPVAPATPIAEAAPVVPGTGVTSPAVLFKARGVSWVEVVDAKGVVLLRKTLKSGEVIGASGAKPLSVFVGRVDAVEAIVLGKPFDLKPLAKNNGARFEVK